MFRKHYYGQLKLTNFNLPFNGYLKKDNRWVQLAERIPWQELEDEYLKSFKNPSKGNMAIPARVAIGALIIKEMQGYSERELVAQICENHYYQYFLGYNDFLRDEPFDHTSVTNFQRRITKESIDSASSRLIQTTNEKIKNSKPSDDKDEPKSGSERLP